ECRVDDGGWASCSSPHTTGTLADGSHTFDVRATDAAGNTDGTPASHTWSLDTGPPTVSITAPTTYVNASDPSTYTVTASTPDADVTHVDFYECSNASVGCATGSWTQFASDNSAPYSGSWTPATSPDSVASGKCAQYRYRIADSAGNWTTATSTNEVKSDTDAPTSTLGDPGANLRQTVSLSASASESGGSGLASVAFQ